jgi:hypothetical protein
MQQRAMTVLRGQPFTAVCGRFDSAVWIKIICTAQHARTLGESFVEENWRYCCAETLGEEAILLLLHRTNTAD